MKTISYAITVCTEFEEVMSLIKILNTYKRPQDEIIVLQDLEKKEHLNEEQQKEVRDELLKLHAQKLIKYEAGELQNNFAQFKNKLNGLCKGDYIFQLDADELLPETLVQRLPSLLEINADLFVVPRVNTVKGITPDHIVKWGWRVDSDGKINFPDYQTRLYKNSKHIYWEGNVHERIKGFVTYCEIPPWEEYSIIHEKTIDKQEVQNNFYEKL